MYKNIKIDYSPYTEGGFFLIINTMNRESIHNQIKELCRKSCPILQMRSIEDKQEYAKEEELIVQCKLPVRFSTLSCMLVPHVFFRLD